MIKTAISEIGLMFTSNIQMINAFRNVDLAYTSEDLVYNEEMQKVISELEIELKKAKQIKHGN
jgi:hypothetical protein